MPETGFIPWGAVFESGKKYRKLVAQSLLSIFIHGLDTTRIDRMTALSSFSTWWCRAVFLVGGVNRLVNIVDDRDLCLLYCVKYDSYLITGFIVQSAHFQ